MRRQVSWWLVVAVVAVTACGGKDRVSLSANVSNVELELVQSALGTFLRGGFDLHMRLGSDAPRSTRVELDTFSLARASDATPLVSPLPLTDENIPSELTLDPGKDLTVNLAIDETRAVTDADFDAICAEPARIDGALRDELNDWRPTPLSSLSFTPEGCP